MILLKKGITHLPTLGDGRQSGTSESPSILHVSPESAVGGDLGIVKTGDKMIPTTIQENAKQDLNRRVWLAIASYSPAPFTPWISAEDLEKQSDSYTNGIATE